MGAFRDAISGKEKISVIAEIKRRSPTHGDFPQHAVTELMAAYKKGGASAISVVTEPTLFNGSLELLREVKNSTDLPILRKDFITHPKQIQETADSGASAILLIARMLSSQKDLVALAIFAQTLGLDPVIEIHDETDLEKIKGLHGAIIGINNRNLKTFETDVQHAEKLLGRVNLKHTIIIESAMSSQEDLELYRGKIDAVLVGTAFLISKNPCETLTNFTNACRTA